jgi:hypothetical protein
MRKKKRKKILLTTLTIRHFTALFVVESLIEGKVGGVLGQRGRWDSEGGEWSEWTHWQEKGGVEAEQDNSVLVVMALHRVPLPGRALSEVRQVSHDKFPVLMYTCG